MVRYECVIVFDPGLDEDGVRAQMQRIDGVITGADGAVERHDIWGRRQLAYPIGGKQSGIFTIAIFTAPGTLVKELERTLRINDSVLRHLCVVKDKFAPDLTEDRKLDDGFSFVTLDAQPASEEEDLTAGGVPSIEASTV